jgi:hypothetical protein
METATGSNAALGAVLPPALHGHTVAPIVHDAAARAGSSGLGFGGGLGARHQPEGPSATAAPPTLGPTHDPIAFECPAAGCEYDCGRRQAVHAPCPCKRLMCRKCAGVASTMPHPAPCAACGQVDTGLGASTGSLKRDVGVLLALAAQVPASDMYVGINLLHVESLRPVGSWLCEWLGGGACGVDLWVWLCNGRLCGPTPHPQHVWDIQF